MSQGAIADLLNVSKSSVHAVLRQAREDTGKFVEAGVVMWVYEPDVDCSEVWMCRFCGDKYDNVAGAAIDAFEHLFFFPEYVRRPKYVRVDGINRKK